MKGSNFGFSLVWKNSNIWFPLYSFQYYLNQVHTAYIAVLYFSNSYILDEFLGFYWYIKLNSSELLKFRLNL